MATEVEEGSGKDECEEGEDGRRGGCHECERGVETRQDKTRQNSSSSGHTVMQ
jgi:hypothetical protein